MREGDRDARVRQLVFEAVERRNQTEQAQFGRMQAVRQIAHAPHEIIDTVQRFGHNLVRRAGRGTLERVEIKCQDGQLLADVVVQVARNP